MSKQTAIEWLVEQLNNVRPTQICSIETIKEWCEQAKAMEREQIEDAYGDALNGHRVNYCDRNDYYNKTYKNE